nr:hypothetical protein [Tanacetum cinerariifolium]
MSNESQGIATRLIVGSGKTKGVGLAIKGYRRNDGKKPFIKEDKSHLTGEECATGHIVRAGTAAVNFLNNVVNYKIPLTEGSASVDSTPNYVAKNTRSSNNKTYRKVEPETISSNNTTKTYKK